MGASSIPPTDISEAEAVFIKAWSIMEKENRSANRDDSDFA